MSAGQVKANVGSFRFVEISTLEESTLNPRRTVDEAKLRELAESILAHGVLQPLLVRPGVGGKLEVIAGHRRFRAARSVGLAQVPCVVREDLDDREALEIALIENIQRQDVEPLEEAEALERLRAMGMHVEEISAKTGMSRSHVYGRLKLAGVAPATKRAMAEGRLPVAHALLVARLPSSKAQAEATKRLAGGTKGEGTRWSYRQAIDLIQHEFMVRLAEASFDPKDATLLPAAGACTTCPKRIGNQRELFPEIKAADVCTEASCFKKKADAAWSIRKAAAKDQGLEVLEGEKAKEAYYFGSARAGWIGLDERCWQDSRSRKWRDVLGKHAPPPALVRTEDGRVVELLRARDANAAAKQKGLKWAQPATKAERKLTAAQRKEKEKQARVAEAVQQVVAAADRYDVTAQPMPMTIVRGLFAGCVDRMLHDVKKLIVRGRGWRGEGKSDVRGAWSAGLKSLSDSQIFGLMVEILVTSPAYQFSTTRIPDGLLDLAEGLGISAEIRDVLGDMCDVEKGVCRVCGCTDEDCRQCIERTGQPCHWVEDDLCSACADAEDEIEEV